MAQAVNLHPKGKPYGRQGVWTAIRASRDAFDAVSLRAATGISGETIRPYLKALEAGGYIARTVTGLCLVKDMGVEAPRLREDGSLVTQGLRREQMWRTMRLITGDWTYRDIAIAASTEEHPVDMADCKSYVKHLFAAGYLLRTKAAKPKTGLARYRLIPARNTGPKAPMVQRTLLVWDPNLTKIMWHEEIEP